MQEREETNNKSWARFSLILLYADPGDYKAPSVCGRCLKRFRKYAWLRFLRWASQHKTVQDVARTAVQLKDLIEVLLGAIGGSRAVAGAAAGAATALVATQTGGAENTTQIEGSEN